MRISKLLGILSSVVLMTGVTHADVQQNVEDCIFGDNWTDMARMRNLEVTHEKTLTLHSDLYNIESRQIRAAFNEPGENYSAIELIADADDDTVTSTRIYDAAHDQVYYWYSRSMGDNFFGSIFYEGGIQKAANYVDGDIYDCKAEFVNFDWLRVYGFF